MHGVRQWWVRLSILHKAIVLSCAFVIPILLVVGLLMNDFYDYREKSDDILSEYARCTDYMNAMEQENALLGELTFAAPESDTIDKYADAVQDTASAWERLRSAETDGSTQSEVLKQVIDRTMKSYRVRQETFIAQLHDGTFDAVSYEALRTQGSYLTQYTDQLTAAFLMEDARAIWSSVSGGPHRTWYLPSWPRSAACCLQARCCTTHAACCCRYSR